MSRTMEEGGPRAMRQSYENLCEAQQAADQVLSDILASIQKVEEQEKARMAILEALGQQSPGVQVMADCLAEWQRVGLPETILGTLRDKLRRERERLKRAPLLSDIAAALAAERKDVEVLTILLSLSRTLGLAHSDEKPLRDALIIYIYVYMCINI